jgi:hypothetical protein
LDALNPPPGHKKWVEKQSMRIEEFNGKWRGKVAQMEDFCDVITEVRKVLFLFLVLIFWGEGGGGVKVLMKCGC